VSEHGHTDGNSFIGAPIDDEVTQEIARIAANDLGGQELKGRIGLLEVQLLPQGDVFDLSLAEAYVLNDELIDQGLEFFVLCSASLHIYEELAYCADLAREGIQRFLELGSELGHEILDKL
jgi:hypothetical protein